MSIDISNTVNVNVSGLPSGLALPNANNIAMFTNEIPAWGDEYKVYVTSSGREADFGTGSKTADAILKTFAVSPNLRSGTGSLYVVPYSSVDGTSGSFTTPNIAANIASFASVNDGSFNVDIDGKTQSIRLIDFTGVKTLRDIADRILRKAGGFLDISVINNTLVFTSKRIGENTAPIFEASTIGTDITGVYHLNTVAGTSIDGTAPFFTETLPQAVERIAKKIGFVQIIDLTLNDKATTLSNADTVESMFAKVYIEGTSDLTNITDLGTEIKAGGYRQTHLIAYSGVTALKSTISAAASVNASTNYSGSNTCITMNLKELATVQPDNNADDTTLQQARANGVSLYGNTSGLAVFYDAKNAGSSLAFKINLAAFILDLRTSVFNVLRKTKTKVAQTDKALAESIDATIINVCKRFIRNNFIAPGNEWSSSETFGDPEEFRRLITEQGYYLYAQSTAVQSQEEREQSIAPLRQLAFKSAGEIWVVNLNGTGEE